MNRKQLNSLVMVSAVAAILASLLKLEMAFVLLKPLTTILIIAIPISYYLANTRTIAALTIVALLACLAGDVFLLSEDYFVYGLGAFLLAHLVFTLIFYRLSRRKLFLAPLMVLLFFGGGFYSLLLPELDALRIPVAVYMVCILLMCWQAVSVYLSRRDRVGQRVLIAALLFVFSDSIIAVNKFLLPFELSSVVILSSYWLSIAMIANLAAGLSIQPHKIETQL